MLSANRFTELRERYQTKYDHKNPDGLANKKLLKEIRLELDLMGCRMPKSKWVYNPEDISTHKYLDVLIWKNDNRCGYMGAILNPKFGYVHLDHIPPDPRDVFKSRISAEKVD